MNETDGGPAFPTANSLVVIPGMSLRDWFAGMALQGLLSNPSTTPQIGDSAIAAAWRAADVMIAEREKSK